MTRPRREFSLVVLLVASTACAGEATRGHALLVGCTDYPHLKKEYSLKGPGNDTLLMRSLLIEQFKFRPDDIAILSEKSGDEDETKRPTRAAILRELGRLARIARKGDRVVVFLAGHGSQQPAENPNDPESPEPDGLDEIFLPRDVKGWDGKTGKVVNAIGDKELGRALKAIRAMGASVVVIVDACHAATMVRGDEFSPTRAVPADELVPREALRPARSRSRGTTEPPFAVGGPAPDLVALYAVASHQEAKEHRFPEDDPKGTYHGWFTYTLVEVLTQSARQSKTMPTYVELIQRVHDRYLRNQSTKWLLPMVEGKDRDREFLGEREWPGRSRLLLRKGRDEGEWLLNAGSLHGMTQDSVLAVHPPIGTPGDDRVIGHVRIERASVVESRLKPIAHAGMPVRSDLPENGRCVPVVVDFGSLKVPVAVSGVVSADVRRAIDALTARPDSLVRYVKEPTSAQWLIQGIDDRVRLLPAYAFARGETSEDVGAIAIERPDDLGERLQRVARAHNLISLAGKLGERLGDGPTAIAAELVRYVPGKSDPVPVERTEQGVVLKSGERFGVRITNNCVSPVWVTVLFVDSAYGISPLFPGGRHSGGTDNRVIPGEPFVTPPTTVTSTTLGLEHIVVIALENLREEKTVDLTCLCQPSLSEALSKGRTRGAADGLNSPLGQLLQAAMYGQRTRAQRSTSLQGHGMCLLTLRTTAGEEREEASSGSVLSSNWMSIVYVLLGVVVGAGAVWFAGRLGRASRR